LKLDFDETIEFQGDVLFTPEGKAASTYTLIISNKHFFHGRFSKKK
jgi:hypothetical protein